MVTGMHLYPIVYKWFILLLLLYIFYHVVHLGLNVNSSTHNCEWVVDGGNTMAAIWVLLLILLLLLLTLGAHAHSEGYCSCPVCVCVHSNLPPHTLESQKRDTNGFIAIREQFKKKGDFCKNVSFKSYGVIY